MKLYSIFLLSGLSAMLFLSCKTPFYSAEGEANKKSLRVLTYNIHHASPPADKDSIDLEAIASVIEAADPDLVALQEVDANTHRSGQGNQAEFLAERLGMYVFFGKAIDFDGGEYGTAILSKYPLEETRVYRLPDQGASAEPRVLTLANVKVSEGLSLLFGSTHLDHIGDPGNRLLQIKDLLRLSEETALPLIIAGDLNAQPDSKEIEILGRQFRMTCKDCDFTFPAHAPDRTIDYIIISDSSGELQVGETKVPERTTASDHLPVLTVFYY